MIIECKICLTKYNNQTIDKCPYCNYKGMIKEERLHNKKSKIDKEINSFRRSTINEHKNEVSSFRSSQRTQYETTSGKQIGGNNVRQVG